MEYLFKRHLECHSISVLEMEQYHLYYFSLKGNADAISVDIMFYSVFTPLRSNECHFYSNTCLPKLLKC